MPSPKRLPLKARNTDSSFKSERDNQTASPSRRQTMRGSSTLFAGSEKENKPTNKPPTVEESMKALQDYIRKNPSQYHRIVSEIYRKAQRVQMRDKTENQEAPVVTTPSPQS